MNYYEEEFHKYQEELHEVLHDYPIFSEMMEEIEEKDFKEINALLDKNDEYYLKQAISLLKDLITRIKDASNSIRKEYDIFDKLTKEWEKIEIIGVSEKELQEINYQVKQANENIQSHDLKKIKKANRIMQELIKKGK